MTEIKPWRLLLLRSMYLLVFVGLGLTVWPSFFAPTEPTANAYTVIESILVSFSLLALVGLRYPLKMLPILFLELLWKTLWVVNYASRMMREGGLDDYASGVFAACLLGIVLTPIAIPWDYVFQSFLKDRGDPWRSRRATDQGPAE